MAPIGHLVGKVSFQGPIFKVNMERNSSPSSLNAFIWSREVLRLLRVSESPGGLLKLEVAAPTPTSQCPVSHSEGLGSGLRIGVSSKFPRVANAFRNTDLARYLPY